MTVWLWWRELIYWDCSISTTREEFILISITRSTIPAWRKLSRESIKHFSSARSNGLTLNRAIILFTRLLLSIHSSKELFKKSMNVSNALTWTLLVQTFSKELVLLSILLAIVLSTPPISVGIGSGINSRKAPNRLGSRLQNVLCRTKMQLVTPKNRKLWHKNEPNKKLSRKKSLFLGKLKLTNLPEKRRDNLQSRRNKKT